MPVREPATDVVVLGGGPIGSAIAWRCAQRGFGVAVVDPWLENGPRAGVAWHAAAGMLAPNTELHYTETALLRLGLASLARYDEFAAELGEAAGRSIGYRECGALLVAWDGADLAAIRDLHTFATRLGLQTRLLNGPELRDREPALAPGLPGALHAPGDHQVDPRLLRDALHAAGRAAGVRFIDSSAALAHDGHRVLGVWLADGTHLPAQHVVVAAGAWSRQVDGIPAEFAPAVRPIQGQTLHLRMPEGPRLGGIVRGRIKSSPIYLVPRPDARIIVGASVEEHGFDTAPRAGAVYELLRDAQSLLPEISEAVLVEISSGLRPGSPDNAPMIGASGLPGLIHATGHHRNGILLTPITADAVADLVSDGQAPEVVAPFAPDRLAMVTR